MKGGKWMAAATVDIALGARRASASAREPSEVAAEARSVLVLDYSHMGDAVNREPMLAALHHLRPDWEVDYALPAGFASLFEGHPALNRVIPLDSAFGAAVRRVHGHRYDLVLVPNWAVRNTAFALTARAPAVLGYLGSTSQSVSYYRRRLLRVESVGLRVNEAPFSLNEVHLSERHLPLIEVLGLGEHRSHPDMRHLLSAEAAEAEPYAVLHPGASWEFRRWPTERFGELADRIHTEFGLRVLLVGTSDEASLALAIRRGRPHVIDLVGQLSLPELARLLGGASIFVGNDSGPAHLSAAVGAPSIMLMGPTAPTTAGLRPRPTTAVHWHSLPCAPCAQITCGVVQRCMVRIQVEAVWADVLRLCRVNSGDYGLAPAENG